VHDAVGAAGRAFDFKLLHAICAPPVPVTAAARTRAALGRFMTMPDRLPTASANLAQAARFPKAAAAARAEHDRMANAIRALAMDAVEQAKSGHPGLPMGAADIATVLFTRFLKFDPADPA